MKNIYLIEQEIKDIKTDHGPIYFPFDENENRKMVYSKEISKNQLAFLYDKLYSAYIGLYFENKNLKEELESGNEVVEVEEQFIDNHSDSKFETYINELIDKRIKEKLSFGEKSEAYSGCYATLNYNKEELGYVCLKAYYDD